MGGSVLGEGIWFRGVDKIKKFMKAQRSGLNQIPDRRFMVWSREELVLCRNFVVLVFQGLFTLVSSCDSKLTCVAVEHR